MILQEMNMLYVMLIVLYWLVEGISSHVNHFVNRIELIEFRKGINMLIKSKTRAIWLMGVEYTLNPRGRGETPPKDEPPVRNMAMEWLASSNSYCLLWMGRFMSDVSAGFLCITLIISITLARLPPITAILELVVRKLIPMPAPLAVMSKW